MSARTAESPSTGRRGARGRRGAAGAAIAAIAVAASIAACGPNAALWEPTPAMLAAPAPDSFVLEFATSEGSFDVMMHRAWSPLGVDRAYHLATNDFWAGARFYRVLPDFVVQWGFSDDPTLDSIWDERGIADEPTVASNVRGTMSFARAGPETRSFTLFINLVDNERLDDVMAGGVAGYPPIGRITRGEEVVHGFYTAYNQDPPIQDSIAQLGNEYLRREYAQLDSIIGTRVLREWR